MHLRPQWAAGLARMPEIPQHSTSKTPFPYSSFAWIILSVEFQKQSGSDCCTQEEEEQQPTHRSKIRKIKFLSVN